MTISNPDIVRVIKARLEDCRCHGLPVDPQGFKPCGGCEHDARCLAEIVEARRERDELVVLNTDLLHTINRVAAYLKQAQRERDEARLEVCAMSCDDQRRTAADRGWDCFELRDEADHNNHQFRTTDGE